MPTLSTLDGEAYGRFNDSSSGLGHSRAGVSGVIDLLGTGQGRVHDADGNSNTNYARTVIPSIVSEVKGEVWLATRVFALPAESVEDGWLQDWQDSKIKYTSVEELKKDLGL